MKSHITDSLSHASNLNSAKKQKRLAAAMMPTWSPGVAEATSQHTKPTTPNPMVVAHFRMFAMPTILLLWIENVNNVVAHDWNPVVQCPT